MAMRDARGQIPTSRGAGLVVSNLEAVEFLETHPELRSAVLAAPGTVNRLAPRALCCFSFWKFYQLDKALAKTFFVDLVTEEINVEFDPILLLRSRLMENRAAKAKLTQTEILALIYKTWNAVRTGKKPGLLIWRSTGPQAEAFPEPV